MRKLAFLLPFVLLTSTVSFSQMDKKEKKEWKKKMKALTPESYKALLEKQASLSKDVSTAKAEAATAKTTVAELEEKNESLSIELDDYKTTIAQEKAALEAAGGGAAVDMTGVVYKVQVGAYKSFDLSEYYNKNPNFGVETDEDGTMRYTIGAFKGYDEADKFKKYLRDMGVKGAWIVSYKDGKRIDIKEALEG